MRVMMMVRAVNRRSRQGNSQVCRCQCEFNNTKVIFLCNSQRSGSWRWSFYENCYCGATFTHLNITPMHSLSPHYFASYTGLYQLQPTTPEQLTHSFPAFNLTLLSCYTCNCDVSRLFYFFTPCFERLPGPRDIIVWNIMFTLEPLCSTRDTTRRIQKKKSTPFQWGPLR